MTIISDSFGRIAKLCFESILENFDFVIRQTNVCKVSNKIIGIFMHAFLDLLFHNQVVELSVVFYLNFIGIVDSSIIDNAFCKSL